MFDITYALDLQRVDFSPWAKRSNPCEPRERRRGTVSSKHCATLTRWLDELLFDAAQTIESLAIREGKSERSIRITLSLAFISPVLAEAAMERHGSCWVQPMVDIEPGAYLEGDDVADRRRHGKDVAPCLR